jgi:hypothetical protein
MRKIDRQALELAMKLTRQKPDRVGQIDSMLEDRPWQDVAEFAAYHRKVQALRLKPWEHPPCWVHDPEPRGCAVA